MPNLRGMLQRHVTIRACACSTSTAATRRDQTGPDGRHLPARVRPPDGKLFLDRATDPTTFTTWEQFERFHRDEFVERITEFVKRVGS